MLGLGLGEIILIAIVILVVVGPDRLPKFMRTAGRIYGQFRRAADEMRRTLTLEADRQDAEERFKRLQERRKKAAEERKKALEAARHSVPQDSDLPGTVPAAAEAEPEEPVEEAEVVDIPLPEGVDQEHFTEDLPPGVTVEEWVRLPPHVRELLMGRQPKASEEGGGMSAPGAGEEPLDEVEEYRMPLLEHLRELRKRVIISAVALAVGTGICLFFSNEIIDLLAAPIRQVLAGEEPTSQMDMFYAWLTSPLMNLPGWQYISEGQAAGKLTVHGSLEGFYTYIRVGLLGGAVLTSPIIAFQLWQFIAPGLYKTERKYVIPLTMSSTTLFLAGASFAYVVILPLAFRFFVNVVDAEALLSIDDAMKTVVRILMAFGLAYQLPVVVWFLARLGLIDARDMVKGFRYAIVGIFGISAVITPPDVVTQVLLGIPLVILYGVGIIVAWFSTTKVRMEEDEEEAEDA